MTDVGQFAGRFHPLLVHFPITLLILAGILEVVTARRRTADERAARRAAGPVTLLLGLGALAAVAAAGAGYLLGTRGGYGGDTYEQHRAAGLFLAALSLVTAGASWLRDRRPGVLGTRATRLLIVVTLIVLTRAGHLGATLTHGEGYLTEHAPGPVRKLVERMVGQPRTVKHVGPAERAPVFQAIVQPILETHCVACHGPAKVQGGLRLDEADRIRKGGDHGAVLVPGRAASSELVLRVWLPRGHADAMPPKARRPVSPAEAAILRWWVDSGARFEGTLADLEVPPDLVSALEGAVGPLALGGPTIPPVTVGAPDAAAIAALRARGIAVNLIVAESPFLQVQVRAGADGSDDERVAGLTSIARQVLWLDLSSTEVTDAAFDTIARMLHLTRLNVSRTATTDAGLAKLAPLAHLEYLNLYGTAVSDAGMSRLATLTKLRRVYVWQTSVTAAGVQQLRSALPRVEAVLGSTEAANAPAPADVTSR